MTLIQIQTKYIQAVLALPVNGFKSRRNAFRKANAYRLMVHRLQLSGFTPSQIEYVAEQASEVANHERSLMLESKRAMTAGR